MRVIGLTGGIATGKSTVAGLLAARGAVVVDADVAARDVVQPGEEALGEIAARFGEAVIRPDGHLDRAALGEIIFADPRARRDLEAITHPRISELVARRIAEAIVTDVPLVVVDVPLLYETGQDGAYSGVMLAYAAPGVQRARVRSRDGLGDDAIRQRIDAQMPIDEKRRRATWVIDNGGTREETSRQIESWWRENVGGTSSG